MIDRASDDLPVPPVGGSIPATSTREIRRLALAVAVAIAGLVAAFNLHDGRAWPSSLALGIGAGVVGLAGWWAYHLVGRRNDGLLLLNGFWYPFARGREEPNLRVIAINAAVAVALGVAFGAWNRLRPPRAPSGGQRPQA